MPIQLITAQQFLDELPHCTQSHGGGPGLIDVRSEDEFAHDHLPGAVNWPSLNNEERIRVGTLYKQVNAFEASKIGAALVAHNISQHIQKHVLLCDKSWQPIVYCWRGGKRSGSLALVLGQIGFKVKLIEGGYKAYRSALLTELPLKVSTLSFKVICGPTGSGKTRLLNALSNCSAQVLDLEALANHRSSVLGRVPGTEQPSQKHFDTLIGHALRTMNSHQTIFVEAESKKVGNLAVPEALIQKMRSSPCINLRMSYDSRVKLLLQDYSFFVDDSDLFAQKLNALKEIRGGAVIENWQQMIANGQINAVVRELLLKHYDPTYQKSVERNFLGYPKAAIYELNTGDQKEMERLTKTMIEQENQLIKA
ncbi:MAG: tRNA 2-selenouridine(34) synthase MnmH [Limnohabitans sp.]|nr:tRNA 2-selenouridine(34) synthase MnmH [Limnohabitans sp.]